jgi:formylglycine-generating enzyme required for sulfatase activity
MRIAAAISCSLLLGAWPATLAAGPDKPKTMTTAGGVDMVLIPPGSFTMGSLHGDGDAKPPHKVGVDAFWMDRTEVTQEQFDKLQLSNPSHFEGARLPAEQVTWAQAARFCNARSRAEKLAPCYNADTGVCDFTQNGYRLPTEAEWEYAARAGSEADYTFGGDARRLGEHAWFAGNAAKKTHPVAQKRPNAWGLFDIHGNVAEWCNDNYAADAYAKSSAKNPRGPAAGKLACLRGGAWNSSAEATRIFVRAGENPGFSDACLHRDAIGFRCVRKADGP